jgi:hypothetical protein
MLFADDVFNFKLVRKFEQICPSLDYILYKKSDVLVYCFGLGRFAFARCPQVLRGTLHPIMNLF